MSDSRIVLQIVSLQEEVRSEVQHMEELPLVVWKRLGGLCEEPPWRLRHKVLVGVHACASHLHKRIFSHFETLPWSLLAVGTPAHVLAEVKELSVISNDVTIRKLQALVSMGVPEGKLLSAIQLMQSISYSTYFTEKQHASTATLRKQHDYSRGTLSTRAFVHVFRFQEKITE
eukprot:6233785-Amphidinium_carterae.1